jgi:hypothetical protein
MKKSESTGSRSASQQIDARIAELADWRGKTLARMRKLIREADPDVVEECKWMGTPVWSHAGILCTGETYKSVVKLTFPKGAALADPSKLFNSSLEGNARRAIDIREGQSLDARAFRALIRAAIALNTSGARAGRGARPSKRVAQTPVLLTGGNPQITKGDGDAPVQAYIAAMPGWKRDLGQRLDQLIARSVPRVRKAVRWNSPFYGVEGQGWFLGIHCMTKYVKLAFFRGTSLRPLPPGASKSPETRYLDIYESDALDERQLAAWIRQAAAIPGWDGGSPRLYGGVKL